LSLRRGRGLKRPRFVSSEYGFDDFLTQLAAN
jgi:hypothetical protein